MNRHSFFPALAGFDGSREALAFAHDGGEIIYNLPNGLQAYLLVRSDDRRIDEGPIAIVNDPNQFSGSPTIANGVSCMGCHKHGMIKFADTLRDTFISRRGQPSAEKVLRLYPPKDEMDKQVQEDQERFLDALEQASVRFTNTMRVLRVNPLGHGETIGRDVWEKASQKVARELGLGVPMVF